MRVRSHGQSAMKSSQATLDPWEIAVTDAQASAFMHEGIRLMQRDQVEAALISFDRAREQRCRLPIHIPLHAYGLAACWLNRAEALARLDSVFQPLALHAFDEALVLLRSLPLGEDARFSKRLAIAHHNRALLLAAQRQPAINEAVAALGAAIAVLAGTNNMDAPQRDYLLAVAWLDLANLQLRNGTLASGLAAQDAAKHALDSVKRYECNDPAAARIGLKARHILCEIAGHRLSTTANNTSDIVDEGLDLACGNTVIPVLSYFPAKNSSL